MAFRILERTFDDGKFKQLSGLTKFCFDTKQRNNMQKPPGSCGGAGCRYWRSIWRIRWKHGTYKSKQRCSMAHISLQHVWSYTSANLHVYIVYHGNIVACHVPVSCWFMLCHTQRNSPPVPCPLALLSGFMKFWHVLTGHNCRKHSNEYG